MGTYPLTGVREATMRPQRELIARARDVLAADERVEAAWLGGSFWTGDADAFSDVDVHVAMSDADVDRMRDAWRDVLARITTTVLTVSFPPPMCGGFCVTPEWQRLDLVFHRRSELASTLVGDLLVDRAGLSGSPKPVASGAPYWPQRAVEMGFYYLGHLGVVLGRGELALGVGGCVAVRDTCLVPIMLAERGVTRYGGAKRLNPFLSGGQRAALEALPALSPTPDSIVAFHLAVAREFVRRGTALAAATGADWPAALEQALERHWTRVLGTAVTLREAPGF